MGDNVVMKSFLQEEGEGSLQREKTAKPTTGWGRVRWGAPRASVRMRSTRSHYLTSSRAGRSHPACRPPGSL